MVANTAKAAAAAVTPALVADDISQYLYKSWDERYGMSRQEVEVFQLRSAQRRFEELAPQIAALKDQADEEGVTRIETLNDVVPLLFNHTVYKSYPMSLLENNRFDQLTRWFQRMTSIDLSGVDTSQCTGIDEWMGTLEQNTPLQIYHTSGTSGKLSFFPRTTLEQEFGNYAYLNIYGGGFGAEPHTPLGGPNGTRMPVIYPSARYGRYNAQHFIRHVSKTVSPTPEECYTLTNGTLSADLVSLAGRVRIAQSKGEVSKMKLSESQRTAFKRYLEEQARKPEEMGDFFDNVIEKLRGKRVLMFPPSSYLFQLAAAGLERGISNVFAPDSLCFTGGGGKEVVLPDDWREQIIKFTGIPRLQMIYGMTELISLFTSCPHHRFHVPPTTLPFLLDPESGAPLPRSGTQTGRFAALDLLAQTYWDGIVSGDMVTMEWDSACPCGRKGAFIHDKIERYSTIVTGDDKITCSATVDNTDAALQKLLAV